MATITCGIKRNENLCEIETYNERFVYTLYNTHNTNRYGVIASASTSAAATATGLYSIASYIMRYFYI